MKKILIFICFISLMLVPASALAWGSATHSYFAKKLGKNNGYINLQEMYGAVVPDMFNLMFGHPYRNYLWTQTHYEFMKLVDVAKIGIGKAFAYGFASHNEKWGADYTAHICAVLNPGEGYVVAKTNMLAPLLEPKITEFLIANGIPYTPELVQELSLAFADSSVESAIDLLVSQNEDKQVGAQMALAAQLRNLFVPFLLAKAYAQDLAQQPDMTNYQATSLIFNAEKQFREYIKSYGIMLTKDERIDLMAQQGAQLAQERLEKEYEISVVVPPGLMKESLLAATGIVKYDYSLELTATLNYLKTQLKN